MQIQLLKENLQQAMGMVGKFTAQKAQLPILGQVAIRADEEGIYLMGTDLEMGIRLRVRGKVLEKGEIGVPAKLLGELTGTLPLGAVELKSDKQQILEIRAGRVRAKLQGTGLADFPVFGEVEKLVPVGEFETDKVEPTLMRTEYAISRDETRPALTGILWDLVRGRWVAADGFRLSVVETIEYKVNKREDLGNQLLISGVFLREGVKVARELGEKKLAIKYLPEKKQLFLISGEALVVGRVLEGEYPKYEAIIPESYKIEVSVDRQEMLQAVKTAAIFARDSAHIIKLNFENKKLVVSANAPQVGENQVEVGVENSTPETLTMAFNSHYLSDFLSRAESERITMGVNEPLKPGVFKEVGFQGYQHIISPVRVREEA